MAKQIPNNPGRGPSFERPTAISAGTMRAATLAGVAGALGALCVIFATFA